MWGFKSKPVCPIDPDQQEWIDGRFRWLQEELGEDLPCTTEVILPTPEFFPDRYEGKPDDVQAMLIRVAQYMRVDPNRFKLFLYTDSGEVSSQLPGHTRGSGSAGLYVAQASVDAKGDTTAAIGIAASQLNDPICLVATLAHEVGHEILLGQQRVSREQSDHEPLTDLLTVFLGMGIFTANATIRDSGWTNGRMSGWETKRLGYLNQRMFGYALARFAWTRQEIKPPWMRHVRPDVRLPMKQGIQYLSAIEDAG